MLHFRYIFEQSKTIFGDCGGNISNQDSGVIKSPNYPNNYEPLLKNQSSKSCNWFITVRPRYKVLMVFDKFAVEGDPVGKTYSILIIKELSN